MLGDLHCHSTVSDGGMTPEELFGLAQGKQLSVLALTDHDHFTETPERTVLAAQYGLQLLPAAELSTKDHNRNRKVHLLCYLPKDRDAMDAHCKAVSEQRRARGEEMIRLVQQKYEIPREAIAKFDAQSHTIFKQHIMHALMDYAFVQQIYGQPFQDLFGKEGIARVSFVYPNVFDVARLAQECGAVVILAHPYEYDSIDVMTELADQGLLDGVEARHSRCTPEGEAYLTEYAKAHGLLTTGGSDFHGFYSSRPCMLADRTTAQRELEALFECAAKK